MDPSLNDSPSVLRLLADGICAIHGAWSAAVEAWRDSAARTTLGDLVAADDRLRTAIRLQKGALPPA